MLKQTMEDHNSGTPFIFGSETGVDLGIYDEVAYQHQVSLETPIWFNIEMSFTEKTRRSGPFYSKQLTELIDAFRIRGGCIRVEIAASYNKKQRLIAITDYHLLDGEGNQILRIYRKTTAASQRWHIELSDEVSPDIEPFWYHFTPLFFSSRTEAGSVPSRLDLMAILQNTLFDELIGLVHIGPLRDFPRRAYRLTGASPRDVGETGGNWLNVFLQTDARAELSRQVNYWLERLGYTLQVEWGQQGYVHPMLRDRSGLAVSLKDVGFGISQVLPVLVQGFSSPPGTILILEQPEIHLHPRAQADLGDMLTAISRRGVRLLVETHSEHLLLRLRRRIAESRLEQSDSLTADDVAIYFIERQAEDSRVYPVLMNEAAEFVDPPERFGSFFANDYEETLKLSQAISRIEEHDDARGN
jgi:hypothetical protein